MLNILSAECADHCWRLHHKLAFKGFVDPGGTDTSLQVLFVTHLVHTWQHNSRLAHKACTIVTRMHQLHKQPFPEKAVIQSWPGNIKNSAAVSLLTLIAGC